VNTVLQELERENTTLLPSGKRVPIHSGVGAPSAEVIRRAVQATAPRLACEVGLAFGISTLHILDAMAPWGGRLIGMDPAQHDGTWQGGGLHNVQRAGFAQRYEFHEAPSQQVLPRLAGTGVRIQFAFIDGWHTFDHTLVDFFYIDQMLDTCGIVVLDDVGYPGLRRMAHFIVTNRNYRVFDADPRPLADGWRPIAKQAFQSVFGPLVRDDMTPTFASRALEAPVDRARLVALQKMGDDERRFDHFVAF
jgi:predicted O-methyltransferase YrrM